MLFVLGVTDTDTDVIYIAASLWKLVFETTLLITDLAGRDAVAYAEKGVAACCNADIMFGFRWQDVFV